MTTVVKKKSPIVVPESLRRRAGIKAGDRLNFRLSGGIINIIPELPSADDEYTPEQRRIIDAGIAEGRKGPYYGPFSTADEAISFLNKEIRARKAGRRQTTQVVKVVFSDKAISDLASAPLLVRRAFNKQLQFLVRDMRHPSLEPRSTTRVKISGRPALIEVGDFSSRSRAMPTGSSESSLIRSKTHSFDHDC